MPTDTRGRAEIYTSPRTVATVTVGEWMKQPHIRAKLKELTERAAQETYEKSAKFEEEQHL